MKKYLTTAVVLALLWACGADDRDPYVAPTSAGGAGGLGSGGGPAHTGGATARGGEAPAAGAGGSSADAGHAGEPTTAGGGGANAQGGQPPVEPTTGGVSSSGAGGAGGDAGSSGSAGEAPTACPTKVRYLPYATQSLREFPYFTCEGPDCTWVEENPFSFFCDSTVDTDPDPDCRFTLRSIHLDIELDTKAQIVFLTVEHRYLTEDYDDRATCIAENDLKPEVTRWTYEVYEGPTDETGCPTYSWSHGTQIAATSMRTSGLAGVTKIPLPTCYYSKATAGINGYDTFNFVLVATP